jgi:membrane associated rhomboid family serine protease
MLPLQDAVPTGRTPFATLTLIALNAVGALAMAAGGGTPDTFPLAPLVHPSPAVGIANVWALWLFGDNVEARLGRTSLFALYVVGGMAGVVLAEWLPSSSAVSGGPCAVSAVLGAYAALLPRARVLVLVPAPPFLSEVPALLLVGLWWLLQTAATLVRPHAVHWLLLPVAVTFVCGAAVALARRTPERWSP